MTLAFQYLTSFKSIGVLVEAYIWFVEPRVFCVDFLDRYYRRQFLDFTHAAIQSHRVQITY